MDQQAALRNPQLWNRYAYGNNNPLRFVDPDGRNADAIPWVLVPTLAVTGLGEVAGVMPVGASYGYLLGTSFDVAMEISAGGGNRHSDLDWKRRQYQNEMSEQAGADQGGPAASPGSSSPADPTIARARASPAPEGGRSTKRTPQGTGGKCLRGLRR